MDVSSHGGVLVQDQETEVGAASAVVDSAFVVISVESLENLLTEARPGTDCTFIINDDGVQKVYK